MEKAEIEQLLHQLAPKDPLKLPGNAEQYAVKNVVLNPDSPLKGKRIYFLGSSITLGAAANDESFVDYLVAEDGIIAQKEALSGTTLANSNQPLLKGNSYLERLAKNPPKQPLDLMVVQLSTNDGRKQIPLGQISSTKDMTAFDQQTTLGALEYLCALVTQNWVCPLAFYTCLRKGNDYQILIAKLKVLQDKWGFSMIDLGSDEKIISVTQQHPSYMYDDAHPTRLGYRDLWTPYFRKELLSIFKDQEVK